MKDFDEVLRDDKKYEIAINVIIILLLVVDVMLGVTYYKKIKAAKAAVPAATTDYKVSNYTLTELYDMVKRDEVADDAYEILANWYDYFSKDVVFKNKFDEDYNYNEYMSVKNKDFKDKFVTLILNTKKKDILLMLAK